MNGTGAGGDHPASGRCAREGPARRGAGGEVGLWEKLRANRLGGLHFRRQQVIDGLIADFYCNDAGLVIEIDGPVHEVSQDYDRLRDMVFHGRGLTVLHFSNQEVNLRLEDVLASIRLASGRRRYPEPPLAP